MQMFYDAETLMAGEIEEKGGRCPKIRKAKVQTSKKQRKTNSHHSVFLGTARALA